MASPTRERPDPQPVAVPGGPDPDVDLASYVLTAVDAHLATLQALREQLGRSRTVEPGDRRAVAVRSVVAARRYADEMARALGLVS